MFLKARGACACKPAAFHLTRRPPDAPRAGMGWAEHLGACLFVRRGRGEGWDAGSAKDIASNS
eukprot:2312795-Alexandrium_andersonii.AAC.1